MESSRRSYLPEARRFRSRRMSPIKAELQAMVEETKKKFGRVDILLNNAGTESPAALTTDITEANWDRVLNVNLKGAFLCCQAVIPTMMQHKKGKIVNIGSAASIRMTFFGSADYTASKHGLAGLSQHLAWELADYQHQCEYGLSRWRP
jgi:NAD(P)-dependent dehydrogenase (short-subunit alcohol dehydrogenase family)